MDILIRIAFSWDEQKFKIICNIRLQKLNSLKFENEWIFMYNNPPWLKRPIHEKWLRSWHLYVKNSRTDIKKGFRRWYYITKLTRDLHVRGNSFISWKERLECKAKQRDKCNATRSRKNKTTMIDASKAARRDAAKQNF